MTLKYETKSCEYYSVIGLKEAYFFDRSIEYTQRISGHSAFLETPRLENPTVEQIAELKEFMYQMCGNCFASHNLFSTTAEEQQLLLNGADVTFAINKIHEQLGFLPNNDILLKVLAEECLRFTDSNIVFNSVDPKNTYYMYFKGGRIAYENDLILTIIIEKINKPKKKIFGFF